MHEQTGNVRQQSHACNNHMDMSHASPHVHEERAGSHHMYMRGELALTGLVSNAKNAIIFLQVWCSWR